MINRRRAWRWPGSRRTVPTGWRDSLWGPRQLMRCCNCCSRILRFKKLWGLSSAIGLIISRLGLSKRTFRCLLSSKRVSPPRGLSFRWWGLIKGMKFSRLKVDIKMEMLITFRKFRRGRGMGKDMIKSSWVKLSQVIKWKRLQSPQETCTTLFLGISQLLTLLWCLNL